MEASVQSSITVSWLITDICVGHRTGRPKIPVNGGLSSTGQDFLVPLYTLLNCVHHASYPTNLQRYYHMVVKGELSQLVQSAAEKLGLELGA